MKKIANWLMNPERTFKEGLSIYNTVKRDNSFDTLFSQEDYAQGSIAFNLMETELRNILRIKGPEVPTEKKEGDVLPTIKAGKTPGKDSKANANSLRIDDNPIIRVELLPETLQVKYERNKDLMRMMDESHAKLQDQGLDPVDAANITDNLVNMEEERTANWSEIDGWFKENRTRLESEKQLEPLTQADITKSIKLKRDNINRASKDLDQQKPNVQEKRAANIAVWEKEIAELIEQGKTMKGAAKSAKE